jgi:predicted ATPase
VRDEISTHGHAMTIASATFCVTTWPALVLRDIAGLERNSRELAAYCAEKRVEQIRLLSSLHYAYARAMREPTGANIASMRQAAVALRNSGGNAGNSLILSNLVEALLAAGDLAGAEAALHDGFAFVRQSGERYWLAGLHRLSGQVALKQKEPDLARAETWFNSAIEVARGQHACLLELRAATDLARLWRRIRPDNDVRALLEPILAGIEGGETTADVRDARNVLAGLD